MKTRMIFCGAVLILLLVAIVVSVRAQSLTPQQTLDQYVADLQKNPGDTALRAKIIALALTMSPPPTIPEVAREHYVMGTTFMEGAKNKDDFLKAAMEFQAAERAAPWWGDAYKKLAHADKALANSSAYDSAIGALESYLLTKPDDARDAQDEIYTLKALKQTAEEDESKRQREEQQRDAPKILLRQLQSRYDGATYNMDQCSHAGQEQCAREVGQWPCGCNESEMAGANWSFFGGNAAADFTMSFPGDGTITIVIANSTWLRGTPKGPTISDIVWEVPSRNGSAPVPAWVEASSGLDRLLTSWNAGNLKGRPTDSASYNPSQRYSYRLFYRR